MNEIGGASSCGPWAIVLSGGEGTRLSDFVRQWLGTHRPKQYCAFTGTKSMLARTLERAGQLVPKEHILTVIGPGHGRYLNGERTLTGAIMEQPLNLDTGPGIFLPLARVMQSDPDATVLIFPSDHFIAPTNAFLKYAEHAAGLAAGWRDFIVLLGAIPDRPEAEFGWIELEHPVGPSGVAKVGRFIEKPSQAEADALHRNGALWNTMVMAVRAKTLWDLGERLMPDMMQYFNALRCAVGTPMEGPALGVTYGKMKSYNFSRCILEHCAERTAVIAMKGVMWNDWGRPERIRETLAKTDQRPAFPVRQPITSPAFHGAPI